MPDNWGAINAAAAANRAGTQGVGSVQKGALAGQDNRFNAMQEEQLQQQFAQAMGMSGIAGAGKFSAFMKTPEGQAKYAAFKQSKMQPAKPLVAPTPAPSPSPSPSPQPLGSAPVPPKVSSMGGNLSTSAGKPKLAMNAAPGLGANRLSMLGRG